MLALPVLLLGSLEDLFAQDSQSFADDLWDLPKIHLEEEHAVFQQFEVLGYAQHQVAWVDSENGNFEDSEFRRFRLGSRTRFLREWYLFNLVDVSPFEGQFYENLTLAYLTWSPYGNSNSARKRFQISGGKQKVYFTREFSQSPKVIKTFERSLMVNFHLPQFATGIWASGQYGDYRYMVAGFSGDKEDEFSRFEDGGLFLVKLERDFGEDWNASLDIVTGDERQEIIQDVDFGFSLSAVYNGQYDHGDFAFMVDLIATSGEGSTADTYGIVLMPSWLVHRDVELVGRLQFASASEAEGLRLQKRYERLPGDLRGEDYRAGYFGVNYFLRGHHLKLMAAVEIARMDPGAFDGRTYFTGVRMYF